MGCLAAQPIVNGLEKELEGRARVLKLDLFTEDGLEFFRQHDLRTVPAIVVLDPGGEVRYRSTGGLPDARRIRQAVVAIESE